ncbi:sugar transferase [Mobilitalea sibirica]|uniref:Sugar transferase n=1 Tax=Mobilitalea sibirica TaxID=1462919 RepID=A0A8J7H7F4_9FIRM|nr:sugar transferase [Mobilitalea sibirica]MBH1939410.1 sugar transferase [Mobilitalea sibirica]
MYYRFIKRSIDFMIALLAIALVGPFMIIIYILVRINLGKPVLFQQERIGKDNHLFTIYKFRTMSEEKDEKGALLPNEARLSKFGSFLRSSSLDELPELINILKGELSFIGPRPLVAEYLPYFTEYELQRHKVRGGLIPPEVLYGNITPTWEQQFEYEVSYAQKVTFYQDVRIAFAASRGILQRSKIKYGNYKRPSLNEERHKV